MRAFLAVPADPGWVESVRMLVGRIRPRLPRASWARPEAWHLTLKFLGEVTREAGARFAAAIAPRVADVRDAAIAADGPMVLPPRGPARVLGIGFAPGASLDALAGLSAAAEAAARELGNAPDDRAFRPHVTLARIRDPWPPAAVEEFRREVAATRLPPWPVRSVVLYESRLDPAGAVYTALAEWPTAATAVAVRG